MNDEWIVERRTMIIPKIIVQTLIQQTVVRA